MRWSILRPLLVKEVLRHLADRGGIILIVLLVGLGMLLSFFGNRTATPGGGIMPTMSLCYIDFEVPGPFVEHLRDNQPPELKPTIRFRPMGPADRDFRGRIVYPHNVGAIQLRRPEKSNSPGVMVWFWSPANDASGMSPYAVWFWKEATRYEQNRAQAAVGSSTSVTLPPPGPIVAEDDRFSLEGGLDIRSGIASSLVMFGLFFVCVYLLPSLTCEERERGVMLAQALTPATTAELLAARFLFYPVLAILLSATLAGTYRPAALFQPFFWATLIVAAVGSMGIGLTIASLARTQREASMIALGYLLILALFQFICQQGNIPVLPWISLEYHYNRILHTALTGVTVLEYDWAHLAGATFLAGVWTVIAARVFRRYGWQ
jgi:hypothetical protein